MLIDQQAIHQLAQDAHELSEALRAISHAYIYGQTPEARATIAGRAGAALGRYTRNFILNLETYQPEAWADYETPVYEAQANRPGSEADTRAIPASAG